MKENPNFGMKKKGDTSQFMFMILAIVAIATILVLAMWLNTIYSKIKESNEIKNCQASIAAHAFVAGATKGEIYTDVKCPTRTVRLKPDDPKVNEKIAEDMHRCWYEWGKGKLRLFEGEGIFCHVCSIYQFEEYDRKIYGLMEYIATQKIKTRFVGDTPGITYMDYFQGYETPNSREYINDMDKQNISQVYNKDYLDTNYKYASFFIYASGKDWITRTLEGGGRTAAVAGGGVALLLGGTAGLATIGAANVWNPVGWFILAGVGGTVVYFALFGGDEPAWMTTITFNSYDAKTISELGCQQIATNQLTKTVK